MKKLTNDELKKIKEIELDILQEIDRICKKCDIKYSLAYGTLLGAVRHKGFIPWDDDIDIMMCRQEYEKFRSVVEKEIAEDYYLADVEKDKDYGFFFCKVMRKGTIMQEESISRNTAPSGVFVDIFVLDALPNEQRERKKQYNLARILGKMCICRSRYYFGQKTLRYFVYRTLGLLYKMIPKQWFINAYVKNARQYESSDSSQMCAFLGALELEKETYPQCIFEEYTTLNFEKIDAMAVSNYELVLKTTYGDYMKLPPMEERFPHHFINELFIEDINIMGD